jgi:DNA-binding IclR family transcriptional regulator
MVRQGAHFAFHDDRVSARVITAFQSGERHALLLEELAGNGRVSTTRRRALARRLERIRERGHDEGPSDTLSGVIDICFPIFDHDGAVAALTLVYLKQRDARVSVPGARAALRQAATAISRALGWLG